MKGTLTIPVYDWNDAYGHTAPYVVEGTPGDPTLSLWDGYRWIALSEEVRASITYPEVASASSDTPPP